MRLNVLFIFVILISSFGTACWRSIDQERIVGSPELRLRITSWPVFLWQSGYAIESSTKNGWFRRVNSWTQDDPWPVSMINVEVLSPSIAYYFNTSTFSVTVDAGKSWTTFDYYTQREKVFGRSTQDWPHVEINPDGHGVLFERYHKDANATRYIKFLTDDFGQTWTPAVKAYAASEFNVKK